MDIDFVRQVIGLARRHGAASLVVEHEGTRVEITRHAGHAVVLEAAPVQTPVAVLPVSSADVAVITSIKAPMAGIVHLAARPADEAFVKNGDRIEKGQQVAILEAMKTFSAIKAQVAGEIVEICVASSDEVSAGDAILRVRQVAKVD